MSHEETENYNESDIKEELYMLYLEIKEDLTKKNIELDKEQLEEAANSTKISTIINYIREMVYILINTKLPKKEEESKTTNNTTNINSEIAQLESHIRKLEFDIRLLMQKEFQSKIKRDALEIKINSYMEMENEFEELKEKVKYEGGKFLNNERKDNEIIILRQENGILKKEIEKHEIINKNYETKIKSEEETIQDLKKQLSLLNQQISKLELNSQKVHNNTPNTNNSSINININNNGNSSSKWIIKQENQDISNYNNNNINNNSNMNSSSFSNLGIKKRKINNFTKNHSKYMNNCISNNNNNCNINIGTRYGRYESGQGRAYNGLQNKNHKSTGMNTIDNNNAFTATYNKILNNLCVKENKSPNKRENKNKKKNNSMYIEEYDKSLMENKYISHKSKKFNSNRKNNNGYNKIMGLIPNSRFPLSGKNQAGKSSNAHSLPKKYLQKDKNTASYSSLILQKK
jgi:hypothetical protein